MTDRSVQKLPTPRSEAVATQGNEMIDALRALGLLQHIGVQDPVTTADASDLTTVQALANALKTAHNAHCADTTVHDAADATNTTSAAAATDQTTSNTLLNELKTDFNAHIVLSAPHGGRVAGEARVTIGTISTANASDLATSIALANALKAAFNRHYALGARKITYFGP